MIRCAIIALLLLPVAGVVATLLRIEPGRRAYQGVTDFTLTEASGKTVRLADLRGKVWVASFIFTSCAGSCPIMTHHLARAQTDFPVRDDFKLVSVSVDPERDTPAVLMQYAAKNGADRSRWWFLTGDKTQIQRLSRETFKLPVDEDGEEVNHSSKFVLVDRNGMIRSYYDGLDVETVKQLTRDVKQVLAEKS
jgi:cytochrome oxidase Cu insertion factor (SCO1/SenC/PrrC family)